MISVYLSAVFSSSLNSFPTAVEAFVPLRQQGCNDVDRAISGQILERRVFSSRPLFVAKSGGKMIETAEEFEDFVLAEDSPRPVLAFFSAAW